MDDKIKIKPIGRERGRAIEEESCTMICVGEISMFPEGSV